MWACSIHICLFWLSSLRGVRSEWSESVFGHRSEALGCTRSLFGGQQLRGSKTDPIGAIRSFSLCCSCLAAVSPHSLWFAAGTTFWVCQWSVPHSGHFHKLYPGLASRFWASRINLCWSQLPHWYSNDSCCSWPSSVAHSDTRKMVQ